MTAPVAKLSEIPPGTTKRVVVGGKAVLLCNAGGSVYGIEDVCTHDGGPLDQGELTGTRIMCPRHGAFFDVTHGRGADATGHHARRHVRRHSRRRRHLRRLAPC